MKERQKKQSIKNKSIGGFTILEILLMVIVLSVSLIAIITTLNNGMGFIQKTRERTIAINLAREGIESIFQIRDTNRRRRAGKKEECWLKINPMVDDNSNGCNIDDKLLGEGFYTITKATVAGQEYFTIGSKYSTELNLDDGIQNSDLEFSLCEDNGKRTNCEGSEPTSKEGKFFRQIEGLGLYLKDRNETGGEGIICTEGTGPHAECGTSAAKEYRFCSKVSYIGQGQGTVELCSVITNFQKK